MGAGVTVQSGIETWASLSVEMGNLRTQREEGRTEPQGVAKLK